MAQRVKVFYIDEARTLNIRKSLSEPNFELLGTTASVTRAEQELLHLEPDIIIYRPAETGDEFIRMRTLSEGTPQASLIILAAQANPDYVRACLKAGAEDYLLLPIEDETLQAEVLKSFERQRIRHKKETISVLLDNFTGGPKLISFLSAKGGVGKTTLSSNTAVALAQLGKTVALVDLDLQMGGVSTLLGLEPDHTLADLADLPFTEVSEALSEFLVQHASGIKVLCAPANPIDANRLTPALVRNILQTLQADFEYVVVDLAPSVNPYFFAAYELSDICFLVGTPNLGVIQTSRNLISMLMSLDYDLRKLYHILNCTGVKNGVRQGDVERLLNAPLRYLIDYDFSFVEQASNRGTPFVTLRPKHPVSRAVFEIARNISDDSRRAKKESK